MKLCIGTVQFGMDYGVQHGGQPNAADAVNILITAADNGVRAIDTASAYGTAEDVVGEFVSRYPEKRNTIEIISKLPPDATAATVCNNIENSLKRLNVDYLDCYLLHNAAHIYNDEIIKILFRLKQEGPARRIGASVYTPDEAKHGIALGFDVLQVPYSIFDQRMDVQGVFGPAQRKGVKIHSRSAFTQGLMLMDEENIPAYLEKARPVVKKYKQLCEKYGLSRVQLAVAFVLRQEGVSYLVFGVDNKQQLMEIINAAGQKVPDEALKEAAQEFSGLDEDIIIPPRWRRKI